MILKIIPSFLNPNNFKKDQLSQIIDELIEKYECLVDDRSILDLVDMLGDEIAECVNEYEEVMKNMDRYKNFEKELEKMAKQLKTLDEMGEALKDQGILKGLVELRSDIEHQMKTYNNAIIDKELEELQRRANRVQAQYNYYKKMALEIQSRISVIF